MSERFRGKGWLEDRPGAANPIKAILGAYGARRASAAGQASPRSLANYRGPRLYQGRAQACVGFSMARAIRVSLAAQGYPLPPVPSPWFLYYNARTIEYAGQDPALVPPVQDGGCFPRLAVEATKRQGFCDWSFAPYNAGMVNQRPPTCSYKNAFDQTGLQWYCLDEHEGTSRSEAVAECYRQEIPLPVVFGMSVDKPFEEWRGPDPIDHIDTVPAALGGTCTGRHMMMVLEVLANGDLLVDNWWEDWGVEDGLGIISARLFGSSVIKNVYAFLPVPTYSEGS